MLEAEIEKYLGYSKYDYTNKNTTNSCNVKSKKTVKSDLGLFAKDFLGIWIGASESSKYWLLVLNELKNMGVKEL